MEFPFDKTREVLPSDEAAQIFKKLLNRAENKVRGYQRFVVFMI